MGPRAPLGAALPARPRPTGLPLALSPPLPPFPQAGARPLEARSLAPSPPPLPPPGANVLAPAGQTPWSPARVPGAHRPLHLSQAAPSRPRRRRPRGMLGSVVSSREAGPRGGGNPAPARTSPRARAREDSGFRLRAPVDRCGPLLTDAGWSRSETSARNPLDSVSSTETPEATRRNLPPLFLCGLFSLGHNDVTQASTKTHIFTLKISCLSVKLKSLLYHTITFPHDP